MDQSKRVKRRPSGSEIDLPQVEKRIKQLLRASIRQIWSRYSADRQHALFLARTSLLIGNKKKIMYECHECNSAFDIKDVQVDHLEPIGRTPELTEYDQWGTWLAKLFCDVDRLRVMCKPCHAGKTKDERKKAKLRKLRRKPKAA